MLFAILLKHGARFVLLALCFGRVFAAGWDCQRDKEGKEWVCVAGNPAKAKTESDASNPVEAVKPPVVSTLPPSLPKRSAPLSPPVVAEKPAKAIVETKRPVVAETAAPLPQKSGWNCKAGVNKAWDCSWTGAGPKPGVDESVVVPSVKTAKPSAIAKRLETHLASTLGEAKSTPQTSGWHCKPGVGKEWDCSLVGADPRGMPHVVGSETGERVDWSKSTTITPEDEMRFSSIMAKLPVDPWKLSCGKRINDQTKSNQFVLSEAERMAREREPLEIHADDAELLHGETANFKGSADLSRADQKLWSDYVTHNNASGGLNAQGNVIYQEKGLSFASDTAFMKLKSDEMLLRNAQFVLEAAPARGASRVVYLDSKTVSRYETVTYTTCQPGDADWLLHATSAKIDKEQGVGTAKNAWLEFKGVPFLYTPYISFPVDDRRKSGFLSPDFGYSKIAGFSTRIPYYFNLAPNYDATATLRELSLRGQMMRGELRYMNTWTSGKASAEYMPYDSIRQSSRGQLGFLNDTRIASNTNSHIDLHYVSDQTYLNDLGNTLFIPDYNFVRSVASLNHFGPNYSLQTNADYYQTVNAAILPANRPYARLPQVLFNYSKNLADTGLIFSGFSEAVNFEHSSKVNGQRLNIKPKLSYPFRDRAGFIIPSLSLQHTQYALQNQAANVGSSLSRTAPIFSLDTGSYFERDFAWGGSQMQHTLEPRLFYLYVPKVNQDALPIFDTADYDFNFGQMFRENRFSGTDRLGDANQITAAMTSRLIDGASGLERLRLGLGEIFYFRNRDVQVNPGTPATTDKSNILAEAGSMLSDHWSLRATGQWNPQTHQIDRNQLGLQYNDFNNHLINLAYRKRRNQVANTVSIDQTDVSFRFPLNLGWNMIGRWQYSLQDNVTVQTFMGVERETCCWKFSLIGMRYLNGSTNIVNGATNFDFTNATPNNAVFLQFELKGLGQFGDQIDQFLAQSISGYRTEFE